MLPMGAMIGAVPIVGLGEILSVSWVHRFLAGVLWAIVWSQIYTELWA